jgi:hypothetical protein
MTAAIIWAAVKPWVKSPNAWLLLVIAGMGVVIWLNHSKVKQLTADKARSEAVATSATTTLKAAVDTANEERKALDDTPLTAERAAIIAACKHEASCRERGKL